MSERDNGGPAFPTQLDYGPNGTHTIDGMSLRDWFAGQAMAGWLASYGPDDAVKPKGVAELAYQVADAMLEARK